MCFPRASNDARRKEAQPVSTRIGQILADIHLKSKTFVAGFGGFPNCKNALHLEENVCETIVCKNRGFALRRMRWNRPQPAAAALK
jgi:hypothetical protein